MRFSRILFAVLAAAALSSCRADNTASAAEPAPLMKTYDVPSGQGPQIRSVINAALDRGENNPRLARVELSPNGKLVVVGPQGIQDGVKELLDQLAKEPAQPPPPTISFTYWLVVGKKAKDASAPTPPELAEIASALAAIQKADGPVSFSSLEKLSMLSQADEFAEQQSGRSTYVRQRASLQDGKVIADLRLQNGPQKLETRVQVAPGQLLVLGQSGWAGPKAGANAPDDETLSWVARADVKTP